MSNRRAKNKIRLNGYIESSLYRELATEAKKAAWEGGVFGYIVHLLQPLVETGHRHLEAKRNFRSLRKRKMPGSKRRSA